MLNPEETFCSTLNMCTKLSKLFLFYMKLTYKSVLKIYVTFLTIINPVIICCLNCCIDIGKESFKMSPLLYSCFKARTSSSLPFSSMGVYTNYSIQQIDYNIWPSTLTCAKIQAAPLIRDIFKTLSKTIFIQIRRLA